MMRPALKLASVALSPERQALAEAIAEAVPRRAALDEARTRAEAARGALASAHAAVPAAERAAEDAKAFLIDNPHAPRGDLRTKRQAVADAADDLAIAREVSARADAAEEAAERDARYGEERIATAAGAVMLTAFGPALEAAERAGREFARLAFAARLIADGADFFGGDHQRLTLRVDTMNPEWALRQDQAVIQVVRAEAMAPWQAARAALLTDPSAPLPAL